MLKSLKINFFTGLRRALAPFWFANLCRLKSQDLHTVHTESVSIRKINRFNEELWKVQREINTLRNKRNNASRISQIIGALVSECLHSFEIPTLTGTCLYLPYVWKCMKTEGKAKRLNPSSLSSLMHLLISLNKPVAKVYLRGSKASIAASPWGHLGVTLTQLSWYNPGTIDCSCWMLLIDLIAAVSLGHMEQIFWSRSKLPTS
jgi:hypothetical protein